MLKKIDAIKLQIHHDPLDNNLVDRLNQLNAEFDKIIDMETKGLIIRSRIRWFEEGEKSSRYFCNLEKRSGEKKCIHRIKNEDDEIISDHSAVLDEIHNFLPELV